MKEENTTDVNNRVLLNTEDTTEEQLYIIYLKAFKEGEQRGREEVLKDPYKFGLQSFLLKEDDTHDKDINIKE